MSRIFKTKMMEKIIGNYNTVIISNGFPFLKDILICPINNSHNGKTGSRKKCQEQLRQFSSVESP